MPVPAAPVADERAALAEFLDQQHLAFRAAVYGLTDEQAHSRSTSSQIALANLVQHVTVVQDNWLNSAAVAPDAPTSRDAVGSDWDASGRTLDELMADFDAMAVRARELMGRLDLDTFVPAPAAPWFESVDGWSVRWVFFHLIQELARHAGHADIVREGIDGATQFELVAGLEGWPDSDYLTPWQPPT